MSRDTTTLATLFAEELRSILKGLVTEKHVWLPTFAKFCRRYTKQLLVIKKRIEELLVQTNEECKEAMESVEYLQEKLDFHADLKLETTSIVEELDEADERINEYRVTLTILSHILTSINRLVSFPSSLIAPETTAYNEILALYTSLAGPVSADIVATAVAQLILIHQKQYSGEYGQALRDYASAYADLRRAVEYLAGEGWKTEPGLRALLATMRTRMPLVNTNGEVVGITSSTEPITEAATDATVTPAVVVIGTDQDIDGDADNINNHDDNEDEEAVEMDLGDILMSRPLLPSGIPGIGPAGIAMNSGSSEVAEIPEKGEMIDFDNRVVVSDKIVEITATADSLIENASIDGVQEIPYHSGSSQSEKSPSGKVLSFDNLPSTGVEAQDEFWKELYETRKMMPGMGIPENPDQEIAMSVRDFSIASCSSDDSHSSVNAGKKVIPEPFNSAFPAMFSESSSPGGLNSAIHWAGAARKHLGDLYRSLTDSTAAKSNSTVESVSAGSTHAEEVVAEEADEDEAEEAGEADADGEMEEHSSNFVDSSELMDWMSLLLFRPIGSCGRLLEVWAQLCSTTHELLRGVGGDVLENEGDSATESSDSNSLPSDSTPPSSMQRRNVTTELIETLCKQMQSVYADIQHVYSQVEEGLERGERQYHSATFPGASSGNGFSEGNVAMAMRMAAVSGVEGEDVDGMIVSDDDGDSGGYRYSGLYFDGDGADAGISDDVEEDARGDCEDIDAGTNTDNRDTTSNAPLPPPPALPQPLLLFPEFSSGFSTDEDFSEYDNSERGPLPPPPAPPSPCFSDDNDVYIYPEHGHHYRKTGNSESRNLGKPTFVGKEGKNVHFPMSHAAHVHASVNMSGFLPTEDTKYSSISIISDINSGKVSSRDKISKPKNSHRESCLPPSLHECCCEHLPAPKQGPLRTHYIPHLSCAYLSDLPLTDSCPRCCKLPQQQQCLHHHCNGSTDVGGKVSKSCENHPSRKSRENYAYSRTCTACQALETTSHSDNQHIPPEKQGKSKKNPFLSHDPRYHLWSRQQHTSSSVPTSSTSNSTDTCNHCRHHDDVGCRHSGGRRREDDHTADAGDDVADDHDGNRASSSSTSTTDDIDYNDRSPGALGWCYPHVCVHTHPKQCQECVSLERRLRGLALTAERHRDQAEKCAEEYRSGRKERQRAPQEVPSERRAERQTGARAQQSRERPTDYQYTHPLAHHTHPYSYPTTGPMPVCTTTTTTADGKVVTVTTTTCAPTQRPDSATTQRPGSSTTWRPETTTQRLNTDNAQPPETATSSRHSTDNEDTRDESHSFFGSCSGKNPFENNSGKKPAVFASPSSKYAGLGSSIQPLRPTGARTNTGTGTGISGDTWVVDDDQSLYVDTVHGPIFDATQDSMDAKTMKQKNNTPLLGSSSASSSSSSSPLASSTPPPLATRSSPYSADLQRMRADVERRKQQRQQQQQQQPQREREQAQYVPGKRSQHEKLQQEQQEQGKQYQQPSRHTVHSREAASGPDAAYGHDAANHQDAVQRYDDTEDSLCSLARELDRVAPLLRSPCPAVAHASDALTGNRRSDSDAHARHGSSRGDKRGDKWRDRRASSSSGVSSSSRGGGSRRDTMDESEEKTTASHCKDTAHYDKRAVCACASATCGSKDAVQHDILSSLHRNPIHAYEQVRIESLLNNVEQTKAIVEQQRQKIEKNAQKALRKEKIREKEQKNRNISQNVVFPSSQTHTVVVDHRSSGKSSEFPEFDVGISHSVQLDVSTATELPSRGIDTRPLAASATTSTSAHTPYPFPSSSSSIAASAPAYSPAACLPPPAPITIEYTQKPAAPPHAISHLPRTLSQLSTSRDGAICTEPQTLPLYWGMRLVSTSNRTGCMVQEVASELNPIVVQVDRDVNRNNAPYRGNGGMGNGTSGTHYGTVTGISNNNRNGTATAAAATISGNGTGNAPASTHTLPRGLAAQIGIQPQDRVVYINNRFTRDTQEWHWANTMAEEDIRDGLTDKISMQIERNGKRYVIYVPITY